MAHIPKKDRLLLTHLRKDARIQLTKLSRLTGIPVSTLFDMLRRQECFAIKRHTALLDWDKLGCQARAVILMKVPAEKHEEVSRALGHDAAVNTLLRISNGYDFFIEGVFGTVRDAELWLATFERKYPGVTRQSHFIVDDVIREGFMSEPDLV
jgi:DNA-binding Lrp family transcriptional regulator